MAGKKTKKFIEEDLLLPFDDPSLFVEPKPKKVKKKAKADAKAVAKKSAVKSAPKSKLKDKPLAKINRKPKVSETDKEKEVEIEAENLHVKNEGKSSSSSFVESDEIAALSASDVLENVRLENEELPPIGVREEALPLTETIVDYGSEELSAQAPLLVHLRELRNRLLFAVVVVLGVFLISYGFKEVLFDVIIAPLAVAQGGQAQMIFTGVAELFFTYIKLCFLTGLFVGLPLILWEIWQFISPGLYKKERKVMLPMLFCAPFLFYAGGLFTYFFVMPVAIKFFFAFESETVRALPAVREYLNFFTKMVFAFGLAFQLPVVLVVLGKVGVLTADMLRGFRRYAVVCVFAASAILTPPDPLSQCMLAVPLLVLYELSILMMRKKHF